MTATLRPFWRRLLVPAVITMVGLATLVSLGVWQLQRKAWKEDLIATLDAQLKAAPVPLPPPPEWGNLTPENAEYRRVRFSANFQNENDALLFTGASALRPDIKEPGYFVFSPVTLPDGRRVVVNRGFLQSDRYPGRAGTEEITGYIRFAESPSTLRAWLVPEEESRRVWLIRDHRDMARTKKWGEVAPFYIDQELPVPPDGFPKPGPLAVKLKNDHLGYAITWFGLAAALAAVFAGWAIRERYNKTA
ncbi:MAG: SURF1 family protein [Pseudorhodoplanes sp.]|uniref:SURF1 family protein n=1 Tax=Pseudorhodoplanes sp. TaxID=1934341 RepID=UPI003D0A2A54